MAFVNFGNLWSLMSKYRFIPDPDCIQDDLRCLICKKLMIDSFQSGCGCQYCYKCIQGYLGGENKHCPGNKRECKEEYLLLEENVLRNAMLNRKLSRLKVLCPNESCQCVEELSRMEDHLALCVKETLDCPYVVLGCFNNEKVKISTHLSEDILDHTHLLLEYIQNIKNEVSTLKEESKNNDNMRKDIGDLKEELETTKSMIISLKEELEVTKSIVTHLNEELRVKENEMSELKEDIHSLKDEYQKTKLEIMSLKESKEEKIKMKNDAKLMKRGSTDKEDLVMEKLNKSIKNTNERLDELKETIERMDVWTHREVNIGETFFSVDRFSVRKTQNEEILSPYFYSHDKGYKLRLKVFPGGDCDGKGTHLSVYFIMCKGKYDDQLPWPCKYSIKISLIDQINQKEHDSQTLNHSNIKIEDKDTFDKSFDEKNGGFGIPRFCSVKDLWSVAGLCLNDVIIIKCSVRPPPGYCKKYYNKKWPYN